MRSSQLETGLHSCKTWLIIFLLPEKKEIGVLERKSFHMQVTDIFEMQGWFYEFGGGRFIYIYMYVGVCVMCVGK